MMTKSTQILLVFLTVIIQLRNCYVQCDPDVFANGAGRRQRPETTKETAFCQMFVRSKGYRCDEHKIYTDDGFGLLLHRVGLVQPASPVVSESGSVNTGNNRNSSKVGISRRTRKKVKSRMTSEVKFSDPSIRNPGPVTTDFVAERGQPYQPDRTKTDPFSRFAEVIPIDRATTGSLGGDGLDSLGFNRPLSLQPYTLMNPDHLSNARPFPEFGMSPIPTPLSDDGVGRHLPDGGISAPAHGPSGDTPKAEPTTVVIPPDWYIPYKQRLPSPPRVRSKPHINYPGSTRIAPPSADQPYSMSLSPELPSGEQPPQTASDSSSAPRLPGNSFPPEWSVPPFPGNSFPPELSAPPFPGNSFAPELASPPFPGNLFPPELSAPPFPGNPFPPELPGPAASPLVPESPPPDDKSGCSAVLLLHHELLNGDSWFKEVDSNDPNALLPFLLADDGFDVWVGHGRATYWSHDHQYLDIYNHTYWDWTWDQFAQHDLPTTLRYINKSKQSAVHIVGVSQSAAVAVAAATQPDVACLMKSIVLLGPTIYHGRETPSFLATWAGIFEKLTSGLDSTTVSGQFNISRDFGIQNLTLGGPASMVSGPDCCISSYVTLFDNGWDGTTSYKNFQHFEQGFFTNTFQHYDYGTASRNQDAYGQPTPVAYSPANIPADLPVQVIYGENDFFSNPTGVRQLLAMMPKLPATVYLPTYAHFDLFFSSNRNDDVYRPIRSFLQDLASTI